MLNNYTQLILQTCQWFVNLIYLNLLWLLFTLFGGVLFGIAPATYALFNVSKLMREGDIEKKYLPVFWKYYRDAFIWSQQIGIILFLSVSLLIFDIHLFWSLDFTGNFLIAFLFISLFLILMISISFLYPLMAYFTAKPIEYFKIAFFIGFKHLHYTILLLAGVAVIAVVSFLIPPLLLLLLASSIAMWMTWLSSYILPEYVLEGNSNEERGIK